MPEISPGPLWKQVPTRTLKTSSDVNPAGRPFDWHLRYCLEGAWQNDLPADYISKWIMSQELVRDPNDKQRSDRARIGSSPPRTRRAEFTLMDWR